MTTTPLADVTAVLDARKRIHQQWPEPVRVLVESYRPEGADTIAWAVTVERYRRGGETEQDAAERLALYLKLHEPGPLGAPTPGPLRVVRDDERAPGNHLGS